MDTVEPQRDAIWEESWNLYYDSYYHEMESYRLIGRWLLFDVITRLLMAITASGSAVAGWTLWEETGWLKALWAFLAGTAALLAIIHGTLGVQPRLKNLTDSKRRFVALRVDVETLLAKMKIETAFPLEPFREELISARSRYQEGITQIEEDILCTKSLKHRAQDDVDLRLRVASRTEDASNEQQD